MYQMTTSIQCDNENNVKVVICSDEPIENYKPKSAALLLWAFTVEFKSNQAKDH